jgi:hypothetical protein
MHQVYAVRAGGQDDVLLSARHGMAGSPWAPGHGERRSGGELGRGGEAHWHAGNTVQVVGHRLVADGYDDAH